MYKIKASTKRYLKENKITNRNIHKITGISENYISQLVHDRPVKKITAYAYTKALNKNAEIEDFFEII